MPQMAPMNWLTLFISFTMIFLMFNSLNYFTNLKTNNQKSTMLSDKKIVMNWKW